MKATLVAAATFILGTATLFVLGRLVAGLVGTPWDLSFCALGAFLTTCLVYRLTSEAFFKNLGPSVIIVFSTFIFIAFGHAASQIFERHVAVDFEPIGKFVWATLATSCWLVPLCALTLSLLNKSVGKRAG